MNCHFKQTDFMVCKLYLNISAGGWRGEAAPAIAKGSSPRLWRENLKSIWVLKIILTSRVGAVGYLPHIQYTETHATVTLRLTYWNKDNPNNVGLNKMPWRKKWQPTPTFLPGKPHGQRGPVGYSPRGQTSWTRLITQIRQRITLIYSRVTLIYTSHL